MPLSLPKRLAMNILNCGKRKVWIDPTKINEMKKVRTRAEIRQLIQEGTIKEKPSIRGKTKDYFDYVYSRKKWPKLKAAEHKKKLEKQQIESQKRKEKYEKQQEKYLKKKEKRNLDQKLKSEAQPNNNNSKKSLEELD